MTRACRPKVEARTATDYRCCRTGESWQVSAKSTTLTTSSRQRGREGQVSGLAGIAAMKSCIDSPRPGRFLCLLSSATMSPLQCWVMLVMLLYHSQKVNYAATTGIIYLPSRFDCYQVPAKRCFILIYSPHLCRNILNTCSS